jgi:hypothetical protein
LAVILYDAVRGQQVDVLDLEAGEEYEPAKAPAVEDDGGSLHGGEAVQKPILVVGVGEVGWSQTDDCASILG